MQLKLILVSIFLITWQPVQAQLKLPAIFQSLLEEGQLSFNTPLENRYKRARTTDNQLLKCDFAMKIRRGDLEIRYLIRPDDGVDPRSAVPHIQAISTLSTVATNEQEAVIALHRMDSLLLREQFGAEWGTIAYFQPKRSFSSKQHGKMLSLYTEGKAQVFIFFLFNQPSEALEREAYTLQF